MIYNKLKKLMTKGPLKLLIDGKWTEAVHIKRMEMDVTDRTGTVYLSDGAGYYLHRITDVKLAISFDDWFKSLRDCADALNKSKSKRETERLESRLKELCDDCKYIEDMS